MSSLIRRATVKLTIFYIVDLELDLLNTVNIRLFSYIFLLQRCQYQYHQRTRSIYSINRLKFLTSILCMLACTILNSLPYNSTSDQIISPSRAFHADVESDQMSVITPRMFCRFVTDKQLLRSKRLTSFSRNSQLSVKSRYSACFGICIY